MYKNPNYQADQTKGDPSKTEENWKENLIPWRRSISRSIRIGSGDLRSDRRVQFKSSPLDLRNLGQILELSGNCASFEGTCVMELQQK